MEPASRTLNTTGYVPLTVHSHYSLLESAIKIGDLIQAAKQHGFKALGLCDSGVMYGAVEFYNKAHEAGIKPLIGAELFLMDGDITDRTSRAVWYRVNVLCQTFEGYQNLVRLISIGQLEGFYYKPRINWDLLKEHHEGLLLLSGDLSGAIGRPFLRGDSATAWDNARQLKTIFGSRGWLELQDHGKEGEQRLNTETVAIAEALEMPLVITNNDRFLNPGEDDVHHILLCMQEGKTLQESSKGALFGPEYYLKTEEQLRTGFRNLDPLVVQKALSESGQIADLCQWSLPQGESILPAFPLPEGTTEAEELRRVAYLGAQKRYSAACSEDLPPAVIERLEFELGVINQMGFPAYFLIVWEFIQWALGHKIPVGPGRGSAAGSLVAYVLNITNLDPIEHNLLFERFLNPERVSMPDIDIDFCIEGREDVIQHVRDKYGADRVCQIITFGTLAARAAVKAVGRVLDISFADSDRLAKMIPATPGTKLKDALVDGQPLKTEVDTNEDTRRWIDMALKLEGLACNVGIHAAGVVIAKDPLMSTMPIQRSKDGQVISQYPMGDLEKLGLLKMDFLGLRNLTIIRNTLNWIQKKTGQHLAIDCIPLDDPKVYALLSLGDTDGVFQLESSGMKALERDLKPSVFEDINALVALFRPGPLNSGMAKSFVDRKHGREAITVAHPALEPILKSTYGTIVYQEQIMQVAQQLAGYSLGRADLLRRAMGKKKADVMEKERDGFVTGCNNNGVPEAIANPLFDTMSEFAAYCFNRSHSAAYAFLAYQTAYLKVHYPVEYLSALLSSVSNDLDKIQHYILCARRMGIAILPPDVATSELEFTPSTTSDNKPAIRFGLGSIKNVGSGVVETIIEARTQAAFADLNDFLKRVGQAVNNSKTLESLILAGALDGFGYKRRHLYTNVEELIRYANQCKEQAVTGQASLFSLMESDGNHFSGVMLSGDASVEMSDDEKQRQEKELLGFYVSSHPLDAVHTMLPLVTSHGINELKELADNTAVRIGGLLSNVQRKLTRKGSPMLIAQLEDLGGTCEVVAFKQVADEPALTDGHRVLIKGKVSVRGDDSYSVIIDTADSLQLSEPVTLRFEEPLNYQNLDVLRQTLQHYKGEQPVILGFPDGTRMKIPQHFWVNRSRLSELQQDLNQQLGPRVLVE
ncbi:MAG: DNA polymerase III subunit alpha [Vampirovibrionales bacterium]